MIKTTLSISRPHFDLPSLIKQTRVTSNEKPLAHLSIKTSLCLLFGTPMFTGLDVHVFAFYSVCFVYGILYIFEQLYGICVRSLFVFLYSTFIKTALYRLILV
jgi:hypothetical protein